jgi:toxin HigB-1
VCLCFSLLFSSRVFPVFLFFSLHRYERTDLFHIQINALLPVLAGFHRFLQSLSIFVLTGVTFEVTLLIMIKSFKHKGLEEFFFTGSKRGIAPEHADRLSRILDRLDSANEVKDMNYPGSFLHKLHGDREGFHSVKVSGNWRIVFQFVDGDAYIVDYGDYH